MPARPYPNLIRDALATGRFLVTFEYTPELSAIPFEEAMRRVERDAAGVARDSRSRGFNICDRVRSARSHDTVEIGRRLADMTGKMPLVHLAGKDRTEPEVEAIIRRALGYGLENLLLVSGDRLVPETPRPVRYHDSVNAIHLARKLAPSALIAAIVSPFKYREEELLGQYLKMMKKIRAGASYIIANSGWDMAKLQELVWYRDARGLGIPLVANLFMLTRGVARKLNQNLLPGILVTDDLLRKVEDEYAEPSAGQAASRRRLALQIVGVKHMGYAGVHLSGVKTFEEHSAILDLAAQLEEALPSPEAWRDAWRQAHTRQDGQIVSFAPRDALYLFPDTAPEPGTFAKPPDPGLAHAGMGEIRTYRRLAWLHHTLFRPGSLGASVLGPLVRAADRATLTRRALLLVERGSKQAWLGCQMCGFCRLPHTFFVCPETCPKGLANGPCAGSRENGCEFGDRECAHSRIYRLAKAAGGLRDLEELLIPTVTGIRGMSAWADHYRARTPEAVRLAGGD